jgi:hypothetical protein
MKMKKIFFVLIFTCLLASLVLPMTVLAADTLQDCCKLRKAITIDGVSCAEGSIVGPTGGVCTVGSIGCTTEKWGLFCVLNTIYAVTDWAFLIIVAIVVILVIFGALNIMTSIGDLAKVKKGRDLIMYAAIGMVVAIIARAVPSIVKAIIGY